MSTDLFVYGTLQDPAVLGALLDDPPPLTPVTIPGWRVAPVRGQVYPALVRDRDAEVAYERCEVGQVTVAGRERLVQAWVAGPDVARRCALGTWQLDGFRVDPDRPRWLAAICRGREAPRH